MNRKKTYNSIEEMVKDIRDKAKKGDKDAQNIMNGLWGTILGFNPTKYSDGKEKVHFD